MATRTSHRRRAGRLHGPPLPAGPARRLPRARGDRRRDQPRAREADARPPNGDPGQHPRDRPRQAGLGAAAFVSVLILATSRSPPSCSSSAASARRTSCAATWSSCHGARVRLGRDPLSSLTRRTQSATVLTYRRGACADCRHRLHLVLSGTGWQPRRSPAPPPGATPRQRWGATSPTSPPSRRRRASRPPEALSLAQPVRRRGRCRLRHGRQPVLDGLPAHRLGHRQLCPADERQPEQVPKPMFDDMAERLAENGGPRGGARSSSPAAVAAPAIDSSSTRDASGPDAAAAWLVTSLVLVLALRPAREPDRRWRIFRRRRRREAPT